MLKRNSVNVHCKFGARQKWDPDGRTGDFRNFSNGFAKSPRLMVLNIDWVQFVLKNCEILHFLRGLCDKQYCFTSDVMYKKHKRLVYTPPDLSKLVESKIFGLICFPGLIYWDQDRLWLLNMIEDDCYFLGVHIWLSTRCKMFHPKIT